MYQVVNAYGEVVEDNLEFHEAIISCKNRNEDDTFGPINKPYIVMKQED